METTPYSVQSTPKGYEVWQMWWGKRVAGPFATLEEAERECERQYRQSPH
jgi:hypothetical protein